MTNKTIENTVLILGATGGIGSELMRQFRDAGWHVRAMMRRLECSAAEHDGVTWLQGDALNPRDVQAAARGCSVIVHAVNPPGYKRWSEWVVPMLDNTIAAACAHGATIVLPGTVYNYGPDAFPLLREDSPQRPTTRKGAIRVEMEQRLRAASTHGARVLIVRAGDFFGPKAGNSWFSQGLVKPGNSITRISNPGRQGVGHQWGYLPDVARTILALLARRDTLEPFAVFHMAGHWDTDGTEMAQTIQRIVTRRNGVTPKIKAFPWWLLTLASPFVATFREIREMRYLWCQPVQMDNTLLVSQLVSEPHTSLDKAVEATLEGLGCLDQRP